MNRCYKSALTGNDEDACLNTMNRFKARNVSKLAIFKMQLKNKVNKLEATTKSS